MRINTDARDQGRMTLWILVATLGCAFALAPLTESRAYMVVGLVSAGLVCATGFGLRMLRVPWGLIVPAQLVVVLWWATLVYAGDQATGGLLPNPDTVRALETMVTDAMDHAKHYAPPVPRNPDLHATLAVCVGLLTVAVDMIAGSLRHAPAVGLVFLAVYMAPVALLSGHVSLWYFLPGALGFVFLLAAQERGSITQWGRNISYADSTTLAQSGGVYSSGLASAGRRVGFGAVGLAVVLPLLIPTLSTNFLGAGGIDGGVGGNGTGPVSVSNPVLDMRRNLTGQSKAELLRISSPTTPQYVRLAALDSLDEDGWSPSQRGPRTEDVEGTLPPAPGLSTEFTRSAATFDVNVSDDFDSRWLPTIYAPTSLDVEDGEWRIDAANLDVIAADDDTSTAGISYRVNSAVSYPTAQEMRQAARKKIPDSMQDLLSTPEEMPDVVAERARQVTDGSDNAFNQALALEEWFRDSGGFTYTLEQGTGNGMETIEEFLTDNRRGYCEQFASAMAMMARSLGIPSRVAVGFLDGERVDEDTYVFRGTDMHAWPELYFEDVGWERFEPTPSARTGEDVRSFDGLDSNAPEVGPTVDPRPTPRTPDQPNDPNTAGADSPAAGSGSDDQTPFPWEGILTGFGVVAVLAAAGLLPRWFRVRRRDRRWARATTAATQAEAGWAELRDSVRDLRLPWPGGTTPRASGRRLRPMVESDERAVLGLNRLVLAVERARYAEDAGPGDPRPDVEAVCLALASGVSKTARRRATWLPVSLLGGLHLPRRERDERPAHTELLALEE